MGQLMITNRLLPLIGKGVVSPLLVHLTGEHAPRIAAVWQAPHTDFLALGTARRHAAAILLAREISQSTQSMHRVARLIERARDSEVAGELMAAGAPGGLMKALGRCGEALWSNEDYARFLRLFATDEGAGFLRHCDVIDANMLTHFEILPRRLRVAAVMRNLPVHRSGVEDLALAWELALRIHGAKFAPELAQRWARAETPVRLYEMAAEALNPVVFSAPVAPLALTGPFERVMDRKTLDAIALEFRNCLRDFASDLARGHMAVFVQRTPAQSIVFALRCDEAGWRLAEAKIAENGDVPDAALMTLVQSLAADGVRTGEAVSQISGRLHNHVCKNCGPARVPERETWRDRLALGTLWD